MSSTTPPNGDGSVHSTQEEEEERIRHTPSPQNTPPPATTAPLAPPGTAPRLAQAGQVAAETHVTQATGGVIPKTRVLFDPMEGQQILEDRSAAAQAEAQAAAQDARTARQRRKAEQITQFQESLINTAIMSTGQPQADNPRQAHPEWLREQVQTTRADILNFITTMTQSRPTAQQPPYYSNPHNTAQIQPPPQANLPQHHPQHYYRQPSIDQENLLLPHQVHEVPPPRQNPTWPLRARSKSHGRTRAQSRSPMRTRAPPQANYSKPAGNKKSELDMAKDEIARLTREMNAIHIMADLHEKQGIPATAEMQGVFQQQFEGAETQYHEAQEQLQDMMELQQHNQQAVISPVDHDPNARLRDVDLEKIAKLIAQNSPDTETVLYKIKDRIRTHKLSHDEIKELMSLCLTKEPYHVYRRMQDQPVQYILTHLFKRFTTSTNICDEERKIQEHKRHPGENLECCMARLDANINMTAYLYSSNEREGRRANILQDKLFAMVSPETLTQLHYKKRKEARKNNLMSYQELLDIALDFEEGSADYKPPLPALQNIQVHNVAPVQTGQDIGLIKAPYIKDPYADKPKATITSSVAQSPSASRRNESPGYTASSHHRDRSRSLDKYGREQRDSTAVRDFRARSRDSDRRGRRQDQFSRHRPTDSVEDTSAYPRQSSKTPSTPALPQQPPQQVAPEGLAWVRNTNWNDPSMNPEHQFRGRPRRRDRDQRDRDRPRYQQPQRDFSNQRNTTSNYPVDTQPKQIAFVSKPVQAQHNSNPYSGYNQSQYNHSNNQYGNNQYGNQNQYNNRHQNGRNGARHLMNTSGYINQNIYLEDIGNGMLAMRASSTDRSTGRTTRIGYPNNNNNNNNNGYRRQNNNYNKSYDNRSNYRRNNGGYNGNNNNNFNRYNKPSYNANSANLPLTHGDGSNPRSRLHSNNQPPQLGIQSG